MKSKTEKRNKCLGFIVFCCLIGIVFICAMYLKTEDPVAIKYGVMVQYANKSSHTTPKKILLWNARFGDPKWDLPSEFLAEDFFESNNCLVTQCIIKAHIETIPNASAYDAVLFHDAVSVGLDEIHPIERSPHQLYVFVSKESPPNTKCTGTDEKDFFNVTMTYRLDSDIVTAYGKVEEIATGYVVAPNQQPMWRTPMDHFQLDPQTEEMIVRKHQMVAWFVSNCNAISRRDKLVRALQNYIPVDIYGHCGDKKCPRDSPECNKILEKNYKFYLAFENSLCTDYVTEKLYNALQLTIIPIVFGGADYENFAPPHSYINAEDYASAEQLAQYLLYLDRNPEEYRKYFWWKTIYQVSMIRAFKPFCDLCARLNDPNLSTKIQYYRNIDVWLFASKCRLESAILF